MTSDHDLLFDAASVLVTTPSDRRFSQAVASMVAQTEVDERGSLTAKGL